MKSPTLRGVLSTTRESIGRSTLKASGLAILSGAVTAAVGGAARLSIETGIILTLVVAVIAFLLVLVRAVINLEKDRDIAQRDYRIQAQKVGAHRAIWGWVYGAETRQAQVEGNRAEMELSYLVDNVRNSLAYDFFPASHVEQIEKIGDDESRSADERLDALTKYLREQLAAGSYLV